MLTLLFGVFFASSTDVMANFFQLPLMDVLWFFPVLRAAGADRGVLHRLQDLPRDA